MCRYKIGSSSHTYKIFIFILLGAFVLIECCGSEPFQPEYNIEVEPLSSPEPLVLKPDKVTEVTFFIGPRSDNSLIVGMEPNKILENLVNGKNADLTVTLFCNVSEQHTYQQSKINYDPLKGRSSEAKFIIKPSVAAVQDNYGLGNLIFTVDANGKELDKIKIDAIVGDPSPEALAMYTPPVKLYLDKVSSEDISKPDLIISFSTSNGNIPVAIRPIHNELLEQIQEKLGNKKKDHWIFESGVTFIDINDMVTNAYLMLRDETEILKKRRGPVMFSEEEKEKILKRMSKKGSYLYRRIFLDGEDGLIDAMQIINSFKLDRPLRLKIVAANIYAPWQMLYSDTEMQSVTEEMFWGFRYESGTSQLIKGAPGQLRTVMENPFPDEIIFGAWEGLLEDNKKDPVRQNADTLKSYLEKQIGGEIKYCLSKATFTSEIKSLASSVKLILAYGHGSSGATSLGYRGAYFMFAAGPNETLTPEEIEILTASARLDDFEPYFFKSQPIIILNACETGTQGIRTANNNGFVAALTRAGARAVIVTEAPVQYNFAYQFQKDLIDLLLFKRYDVQKALLEARLKHLNGSRNPFGLIYSLYGNPGARIKEK